VADRRPQGHNRIAQRLLLAEIAICRPIYFERDNIGNPKVKIGGRDKSTPSVIQMVQNAAGSYSYVKAVEYCLKSQTKPEDVADKGLGSYFGEVFAL
jgi:hypothetical protein